MIKQKRLEGGRARTDMNGSSGREGKVTDIEGAGWGGGRKKNEGGKIKVQDCVGLVDD